MRGMVVKRAVRRNGILWEWKSRAHLVFGGLSFTPGFSPVFDGGGGKPFQRFGRGVDYITTRKRLNPFSPLPPHNTRMSPGVNEKNPLLTKTEMRLRD